MDDQKKDQINPKGPKQMDRSKQLQTHKVSTDDVENINSTKMKRDVLLAKESCLFPEEQKGRCKGFRGIATHPKREQDRAEKSSYDLD